MNSKIGCLGCLVGLVVGAVVASIPSFLLLYLLHEFSVPYAREVRGFTVIIIMIFFGVWFSKIFSHKR